MLVVVHELEKRRWRALVAKSGKVHSTLYTLNDLNRRGSHSAKIQRRISDLHLVFDFPLGSAV